MVVGTITSTESKDNLKTDLVRSPSGDGCQQQTTLERWYGLGYCTPRPEAI